MAMNIQWTLPVPSTALLGGGPVFEKRLGREVALRLTYESGDETTRWSSLVFQGVEAFKCTYYQARDASMLEGYDRLVDCGFSSWLRELSRSLEQNGGDPKGLVHLMINFDDGPAYEFVCRSFRVDDE